jgi:hypothetical protein
MTRNHHQTIERYFRAFRERDRDTLRSILTPDFHHATSFGEWRDRDAMLDAIWDGVGVSWAVDLQIFGEPPEFMVRYDLESSPGVGRPRMSMAEYVRFRGEAIAEIEVYVGRTHPAP